MKQRFQLVPARTRALIASLLVVLVTAPFAGAQGLTSSDLSRLRSVGGLALSPDGHHLAYSVIMRDEPGRPYGQLWMMDLTTQKSTRLGGGHDRGERTVWSPDGRGIVFFGGL